MSAISDLLYKLRSVMNNRLGHWLLVLLVVWLVVHWVGRWWSWRLKKKADKHRRGREEPEIDVRELPLALPCGTRADLKLFHVPAGVSLVVVAPLGRESEQVKVESWDGVLDSAVPGLASLVRKTKPKRVVWPVQLSDKGFARRLVARLNFGKPGSLADTPWTLVVGRTNHRQGQYVLGLLLRTAEPTKLEVIEVDSPYKWLDVVRLSAKDE